MRLFDSNLIIYSASDKYKQIRLLIAEPDVAVSTITKVEALGYHKLPEDDRDYFVALFRTVNLMPVTNAIIDKAIELRQQRRMSLGDCLIAAKALLNKCELYTNSTADFAHISDIVVVNPLAS
ncbi:type II toxin-antitoxin system VapC family toxin [uncultured Spirosoma sp.]|uniref:type II toxin-antitoxin system VapC family toxin n=1 Tax=uncultured Spirosoma sp. TaxID=278208 RepID=UPI002590A1A5|nr:type II toxin-antitoxin system VapC family toxin [uncultured Spirosoma sp.]